MNIEQEHRLNHILYCTQPTGEKLALLVDLLWDVVDHHNKEIKDYLEIIRAQDLIKQEVAKIPPKEGEQEAK